MSPPLLVGFLTKRGFLQASLTKSLKRIKVGDVMKQPVIRVMSSTPIKKALEVGAPLLGAGSHSWVDPRAEIALVYLGSDLGPLLLLRRFCKPSRSEGLLSLTPLSSSWTIRRPGAGPGLGWSATMTSSGT